MRALASFVSGRRGKWIVLAVWVVVFAALMPLGAKLADETRDDTTSFLPASAESTDVVKILDQDFVGGETTQGLIVYQRDDGLTAADRQRIAADARALEQLPDSELPLTRPPAVPFAPGSPPDLVAPEGDLAYTVLTVPTNYDKQADWGENVRELTGDEADGMRILLTGDLGFTADSEEVFGELDTKLLAATVLLVLVLLGAIYRSVLVALTPLVVVFFAYTVATAFVYSLMSDCCCPPRPDDPAEQQTCPRSGTRGHAVDLNTVKALLTETALTRISGAPHRFCPDPACQVVYFTTTGTFTVRDLRVPVWQKEPVGARMVCYCFGENEAEIAREITEHGASRAVERVREHIAAGRCACELRSPRGVCCLGDVIAAVERVAHERELPHR